MSKEKQMYAISYLEPMVGYIEASSKEEALEMFNYGEFEIGDEVTDADERVIQSIELF